MFLIVFIVLSVIFDIGFVWCNFFIGVLLIVMYIVFFNVLYCRSVKNIDVDKYKIGIRMMFIYLYFRID